MNESILEQLKEDLHYPIKTFFDRFDLKIKSLKIINKGKSLSGDYYKVIEKSENNYSLYFSCAVKLSNNYQTLSAPQIKELFLQISGALNLDLGALVVNYELNSLKLDLKIDEYKTF